MIGYLHGTLHAVKQDCIILDVHGVGYRVFLAESFIKSLPPLGSTMELDIVTVTREDAIHLYGFANPLQQRLFKLLVAISGIGPRQAIHILSCCPPQQLAHAINQMDVDFLQSMRGIGRKTAEKIVVELKGAIAKLLEQEEVGLPLASQQPHYQDVIAALSQLGYRRQQIESALDKVPADPNRSLEMTIRATLRILGSGTGRVKSVTPTSKDMA